MEVQRRSLITSDRGAEAWCDGVRMSSVRRGVMQVRMSRLIASDGGAEA